MAGEYDGSVIDETRGRGANDAELESLMKAERKIWKEAELKPCPFCGNIPRMIVRDYSAEPYVRTTRILCGKCGALGPYAGNTGDLESLQRAFKKWNGRKAKPQAGKQEREHDSEAGSKDL